MNSSSGLRTIFASEYWCAPLCGMLCRIRGIVLQFVWSVVTYDYIAAASTPEAKHFAITCLVRICISNHVSCMLPFCLAPLPRQSRKQPSTGLVIQRVGKLCITSHPQLWFACGSLKRHLLSLSNVCVVCSGVCLTFTVFCDMWLRCDICFVLVRSQDYGLVHPDICVFRRVFYFVFVSSSGVFSMALRTAADLNL